MPRFRSRPRFTVRRLMIVVVIAALTLKGYFLWQRSSAIAKILLLHEDRLATYQENRDTVYLIHWRYTHDYSRELSPGQEARRAADDRWVKYEEQLVRKYRHAMYFPWVSIEPDPPPPRWGR